MTAIAFYDTKNDPYEVNNLVADPVHTERIKSMCRELLNFMIDHKDLGLYPWSMRQREDPTPFYEYVRISREDVEQVVRAAAFASIATERDLSALDKFLQAFENVP